MFARLKSRVAVLAVLAVASVGAVAVAAPAASANASCSNITATSFNDAVTNSNSTQYSFAGCTDVALAEIDNAYIWNMSIGPTSYDTYKWTRSTSNCPIQVFYGTPPTNVYNCSPIGGGTMSSFSFYSENHLSCWAGTSVYRPAVFYRLKSYANGGFTNILNKTFVESDIWLPNC